MIYEHCYLLEDKHKYPLLSVAKEIELLKQWHQQKDRRARDKLIMHNLRLVAKVAKRYQTQYCSINDLMGFGVEGLGIAIDKFDIKQGYKLCTYAVPWIHQTVNRGFLEMASVRLPDAANAKNRRLIKVIDAMKAEGVVRTPATILAAYNAAHPNTLGKSGKLIRNQIKMPTLMELLNAPKSFLSIDYVPPGEKQCLAAKILGSYTDPLGGIDAMEFLARIASNFNAADNALIHDWVLLESSSAELQLKYNLDRLQVLAVKRKFKVRAKTMMEIEGIDFAS